MSVTVESFVPSKAFLVCVDSDGCAMDTMDIKHFRCFGPCMVDEWSLDAWREPILNRWNEINLYSMTRGINRFKGLIKALLEINETYTAIEDLPALENWVETSPELSNGALEKAIAAAPDHVSLVKALAWSKAVNAAITQLPDSEKLPFPGVKEALAYAHEFADVAIVSSANLDAVIDEWTMHGLLEHTDIVMSQNVGSKAFCIAEMLKKGYAPDHVLMCGDAPGDKDAAEKNGVFYYPILVRREGESWEEFRSEGLQHLLNNTYEGTYQTKKNEEFYHCLGQA